MGIDPGSRRTGFAIIRTTPHRLEHISHGVVVLDEKQALPLRLRELGHNLNELLKKYNPHYVVIEKIFLGKNADSAFKLGHARGVATYEACKAGAEVIEYSTREVKKGITGNGASDKLQVRSALEVYLRLKQIQHLDASDALALAVFHAGRMTHVARMKINGKESEL